MTIKPEVLAAMECLRINPDVDTDTYRAIRRELTRLSEIADTVDPLVVRLGEVTDRLERADALLRELHATVRGESPHLLDEDSGGNGTLDLSIEAHLSEPRT